MNKSLFIQGLPYAQFYGNTGEISCTVSTFSSHASADRQSKLKPRILSPRSSKLHTNIVWSVAHSSCLTSCESQSSELDDQEVYPGYLICSDISCIDRETSQQRGRFCVSLVKHDGAQLGRRWI
jgi:hypothetical protein